MAWVHLYSIFFHYICTTVLHSSWFIESLDAEPQIWRSYSKASQGFLTVWWVGTRNPHTFQGFNCIYKLFVYIYTHTYIHKILKKIHLVIITTQSKRYQKSVCEITQYFCDSHWPQWNMLYIALQ